VARADERPEAVSRTREIAGLRPAVTGRSPVSRGTVSLAARESPILAGRGDRREPRGWGGV